ncbi:hypothetical protein ACH4TP_38125 [Streptomyces sp. NPDC021012]|uniref:hypothetical protein n=1 Tax=Streptomyces sp. NPDC021012 TaxID=3365107 RepID=UPI0037B214A8
MHAPRDNEEFERMMQNSGFGQTPEPSHWDGYNTPTTPAGYDPNPYGPPTNHPTGAFTQAKPGLTKRGKVGLTAVAVVLVGGAYIGYQSHTATVAENQAHAKEMEIQAQLLRIEELKELNRANETKRNSLSTEEKTRQASVDSCVKTDKEMVGKGFGSPSYREVIDNCLAQYGGEKNTTRFDTAAASTPITTTATGGTAAGGGEEGVSGFLVLGIGAFAVLAFGAAKRGTRSDTA